MRMRIACAVLAVGALSLAAADEASASSHREAPFITKMPKVDGTDFYMFRSYETGRAGFVTILANYQPLQDSYGGPNYFTMDSEALYEIHLDNNGDGAEDLTFQFRFANALGGAGGAGINLTVGAKQVNIPLIVANAAGGAGGGVTPFDLTTPRHVNETYGVKIVRGNRRTGAAADLSHATTAGIPGANGTTFVKPLDYIGEKVFGDQGDFNATKYNAYANAHIYSDVTIPGCATTGSRVFVGQRREMFAVNLGTIFDLVNAPVAALTDGLGGTENLYQGSTGSASGVGSKNVTTIALEVPIACLVPAAPSTNTVIGGWTTASVRQARVINPAATYAKPSREGGAWAQVSRLGSPLVNEVVIGLKDKDRFNSSEPKDDAQFADYVTNPTLPLLLELVLGSATLPAPKTFPRADLVAVFLTGAAGVNQPAGVKGAEMLRLNTALPAIPADKQFRGTAGGGGAGRGLGAAGCFVANVDPTKGKDLKAAAGDLVTSGGTCDPSGFPNGRRPGDDVVDLALRVVSGYLLTSGGNPNAPSGDAPLGDGIAQAPNNQFVVDPQAVGNHAFPYLPEPNRGAGTGQ